MENKLLELLKLEAKEIDLSFYKASIEGEGTSQEVADRRERALVKAFLEKYFPFPYRVTKGNIIDSYNLRSNSIDCIILNPSHPYTIDPKNDSASIIFADGVDFAIEVKPDLANRNEIERSLGQIRSVKKLRRKRSALLTEFGISDIIVETSKRIPTFIFANKTYVDLRLLVSHIIEYYILENVPFEEQFDYIIINNRAVLFNSRENMYAYLPHNKGICFAETSEETLATFLLLLNKIIKSEMSIAPSVLGFYLDDSLYTNKLKTFHDLNNKLYSHFKV
jgi:hypothetical protein